MFFSKTFMHHTALDLICSNELPFDGRLHSRHSRTSVMTHCWLLSWRRQSLMVRDIFIMPWRYLKVFIFPNAGNHQKDLLGAARPMSLKPRTCSHCPSIWASIMLNMDEYGLREDKAQKALRTLYITGLEESQQESKQRVFVAIGNCSWFCVLPVTCLPLPHFLSHFVRHFLQLWGGRFHATICLRPWGLLLRPCSPSDNAADNGPWPRRCTLERQ